MLAVVLLCKRLMVSGLVKVFVRLVSKVVLVMHSPGIHRGAVLFTVGWLMILLTIVINLMLCVVFRLIVMSLRQINRMMIFMWSAFAAIKSKQMVLDIVVLDAVLRLCLNLVEQLIVLVLNVVHQLSALVVVNIVPVSVASVVGVLCSIMSKVLIRLMVVVVVITAPVWTTLMEVTVMLGFVAMVIKDALIMVDVCLSVNIVPVVLRVELLVMGMLADVFKVSGKLAGILVIVIGLLVVRLEHWPVMRLTQVRLFASMAVVDIVIAVVVILASHYFVVAHFMGAISQVSLINFKNRGINIYVSHNMSIMMSWVFIVRLHENWSSNMGGLNYSLTIVVQVLEPWVLTVVQVSVEKLLVGRQSTDVFIVNSMSGVMERSRWFQGEVSSVLMVLHDHRVFNKGRRSLIEHNLNFDFTTILMLVMLNRHWMMLNRHWVMRRHYWVVR